MGSAVYGSSWLSGLGLGGGHVRGSVAIHGVVFGWWMCVAQGSARCLGIRVWDLDGVKIRRVYGI